MTAGVRSGRARDTCGRQAHASSQSRLEIGKSGDASCPFSFNRGPPFELKAELSKEINCSSEIIDDDSYVIHSFERHASNLHNVAWMQEQRFVSSNYERCQHRPNAKGIRRSERITYDPEVIVRISSEVALLVRLPSGSGRSPAHALSPKHMSNRLANGLTLTRTTP